jgi:hypothetical protein
MIFDNEQRRLLMGVAGVVAATISLLFAQTIPGHRRQETSRSVRAPEAVAVPGPEKRSVAEKVASSTYEPCRSGSN